VDALGRRTEAALTGIVFVPTTGTAWERLPVETGWRRLRDWQAAGG
jgi:hypothetical protein